MGRWTGSLYTGTGESGKARAQFVIRFTNLILPYGKTELEITQEMATAIESMIAKDPGEWFCNKYRWPKVKDK
jgi:lauroyl/myristoyl acyltransferase